MSDEGKLCSEMMVIGVLTGQRAEFRKELEQLLNKTCMENGSNTPDFILAEFLVACLEAWDKAAAMRDEWLARHDGTSGQPRSS